MVRTSDDAREQLADFSRRHGISVSAFLEAIANSLPAGEELTKRQQEIVEEARAIDADRRRRG